MSDCPQIVVSVPAAPSCSISVPATPVLQLCAGNAGGGTNVIVTGSEAMALANFTGIGSVTVSRDGSLVIVSGLAGVAESQLNSLSGFTTGISGALAAMMATQGQGVTSINAISGALNISGAGNLSVGVDGLTIIISGDTGAYANFATLSQLAETGATLYGLVTGLSGQNALDYATLVGLAATGSANWAYTQEVSSNLVATGGALYSLVVGASGVLQSQLVATGNAAVGHSNGIGEILSGNLTNSGVQLAQALSNASGVLESLLYSNTNPSGFITSGQTGQFASTTSLAQSGAEIGNKIDSLSGFAIDASGALQALIAVAGPQIRVTGSSAIAVANFTGVSGTNITVVGDQIIVTSSAVSSAPTGTFIFRTAITSGVSGQFIQFPASLSSNPRVLGTLNNSLDNTIVPFQISGIVSSGFWAIFANEISNSGYFLDAMGAATDTGLAATVFVTNNTYNAGSGDFATAAQFNALSGSLQAFQVNVATGIDSLSINYPLPFSTVPIVTPTLLVTGFITYLINLRSVTSTGFSLSFSDVIAESGVSIDVIAKLPSP
jgi:hypothetical protein